MGVKRQFGVHVCAGPTSSLKNWQKQSFVSADTISPLKDLPVPMTDGHDKIPIQAGKRI